MSAAANNAFAVSRRHLLTPQEEQEERMSAETTDPPGTVEYKIIRSASGVFGDPDKLQKVLHEEARAGWDLVEKFDNSRVRLRRSIEWRSQDPFLFQDPYRINVGLSESKWSFSAASESFRLWHLDL